MAKGKMPLRLEWIDPRSLEGNPKNWKVHTQRQNAALNATLTKNGWAGALLYNERTKRLIDGHGRKTLAIKRGDKAVPVLIGNWSEEQERELLATLDPIGQMAQTNAAALKSLTAEVQTSLDRFKGSAETRKTLTRVTSEISSYAHSVATGETPSVPLERKRVSSPPEKESSADDASIHETNLKNDVVFPSDLPWGIPELRSDVLCSVVPDSVWDRSSNSATDKAWYCYSSGPSTIPDAATRDGGILGFFTEDFRFEVAWSDTPKFTSRLIEWDFAGVCLPDFSQWSDFPPAVRLHNLYRSRWCGRYWQEAGIPVIPILQAMGDAEEYADLTFGTLPTKCPVVAVQCRTGDDKANYFPDFCDFLKLAISYCKPQHVVIYGGLDNEKYLSGYLPKSKGTSISLLYSFQHLRRLNAKKGKGNK